MWKLYKEKPQIQSKLKLLCNQGEGDMELKAQKLMDLFTLTLF